MRSPKVIKNFIAGLEKLCLRLNIPEFFERHDAQDKVRILAYHSIAKEGSAESLFSGDEFRTAPADFENQVRYLLGLGYRFSTLSDYLAALTSAMKLPRRTAILTFDDGFRSHYTDAFQILKKYGAKATFYPILECLGQDKISWIHKFHRYVNKYGHDGFADMAKDYLESRDLARCKTALDIVYCFITNTEPGKKQGIISRIDNEFGFDESSERSLAARIYLNWNEIKEMSSYGMEIGLHTISHIPVNSRYFNTSEIPHGKNMLQDQLQRRVFSFSYPFGIYSDDCIAELKRSGFMGAVVTKYGSNARRNDPFLLRRINTGCFYMDEARKQLLDFSLTNCLKDIFMGAKR